MLSVAKLALGQEAYYEQQVAGGLDDYYAGRGESPGMWVGSGAESLGLAGVVGDGDLGVMLSGVNPADGQRLRKPVAERTITVRSLDAASGEWSDEQKRLAPVAGFDLVFSCPKSVSLLHALTDDEQVRRVISDAHERSWQAALGYLESEACVVRRGRGGTIREHGDGLVAAAFRHRTSRAQDPHLHTHVIVANLARTPDGAWRALDGEAILKTHRLAAGYLYEAHLRAELSEALGLRWTQPVKGMAEIEGVSPDAIAAFSTRRRLLVEYMDNLGTAGFASARVAALATRERKEEMDLPALRESWLDRASEVGLGAPILRDLLDHDPDRPMAPPAEVDVEALTAMRTSVSTPEIVCAVAAAARDGASVAQVLAGAHEITHRLELICIEEAPGAGRPARFTTKSLLDLEQEALDVARNGRAAGAPCADAATVATAIANSTVPLSEEQRLLVEVAAESRDRVVCVVGAAGSGKTAAMAAMAEAFLRDGTPVIAAAPSGRAAEELARATGLSARTLHARLDQMSRGEGLPTGCVLVIDEAGMAETRVLSPTLRAVENAGGKVILIGDPAQLPAVGAGGLFATLCDEAGAVHLTENHRQRDVAERDALSAFRDGDAEPYLGHLARRERLMTAIDADSTKAQLLDDWWQSAAQEGLRDVVMVAHRRMDVSDLNGSAHRLMRDEGRLGESRLVAGDREFRAGDRVVCRRNDPYLGVLNGARATVESLDTQLGRLTLALDTGGTRTLDPPYIDQHLDYGYALTGHSAQGASVERAFVLARTEGALAEWGYVAASRAREETRVYAVAQELAHDDGRPLANAAPAARQLADALSRSAAEAPALDLVERHSLTGNTREMARERVNRDIELREQLLTDAHDRLDGLGWLGRRRHGDELNREIDVHRTVLGRLHRERDDLSRPKPPLSHAFPEPPPFTRTHEPVVREPGRRGIDMGLEL